MCMMYIWYTGDQRKHGDGKAKTWKIQSLSKNDFND